MKDENNQTLAHGSNTTWSVQAVSAHTSGPWTYEETTLSICRLIVSVEDVQAFQVSPESSVSHAIAYVPCDVRRAEQEANARLIVAAPDLLAVCKTYVEHWIAMDAEEQVAIDAMRVAIAKAEGQ
jgi:hypothetical protein